MFSLDKADFELAQMTSFNTYIFTATYISSSSCQ